MKTKDLSTKTHSMQMLHFLQVVLICFLVIITPNSIVSAATKRSGIALKNADKAVEVTKPNNYYLKSTKKGTAGFYFKATKQGFYTFHFSNLHRKGKTSKAASDTLSLQFYLLGKNKKITDAFRTYNLNSDDTLSYVYSLNSEKAYNNSSFISYCDCTDFITTIYMKKGQTIYLETSQTSKHALYCNLDITATSKAKSGYADISKKEVKYHAPKTKKPSNTDDTIPQPKIDYSKMKKVKANEDYLQAPALVEGEYRIIIEKQPYDCYNYVYLDLPAGSYIFYFDDLSSYESKKKKNIARCSFDFLEAYDDGLYYIMFIDSDSQEFHAQYLQSVDSYNENTANSENNYWTSIETRVHVTEDLPVYLSFDNIESQTDSVSVHLIIKKVQ